MRTFGKGRYTVKVYDSMEVNYYAYKDDHVSTKTIKRGDVYERAQVFNSPDKTIDIHLTNGDIISMADANYFTIKKIESTYIRGRS